MSSSKTSKTSTARKQTESAQNGPAPTTLVKPVDNAIRILRFLSVIGKASTVTLIARELKINPSTCFNILRTLVWNGVIDFDSTTKTYKTGLGAVDLANRALLRHGNVAELMQPQLEKFAQTYAVTLMVWRRVGEDRMMLVSIIDSTAAVRIHLRLGQRLPLLIGASGRVMAAFGGLEEAEIRRQFDQLKWGRPIPIEEYLAQVDKARKSGTAIDDGKYIPGMYTVAAPIFNPEGRLRGVVAAAMFRGQHDKDATRKIIAEVKRLGDVFSSQGKSRELDD